MKTRLSLFMGMCLLQICIMDAQNVGVGTSTPVSKLDVEGGVSIGAAYSGTSAAPINGAIIEGVVGIGTPTPLGRLHISSGSFLTANLQSSSNVGTWLSIGNTDPGGRWFSFISTATNNGEGAGKLILTRNVAANSTAGTLMSFEHATSNVGIGTFAPTASAILDVTSTNKGLLIPRVALTATNLATPVTTPATSLLVYNTATAGVSPNNVFPGFYYWNGTNWARFDTGNNTGDWKLDGNSNGALYSIGTNDNFDFAIETSGVEKVRLINGNAGNGTLGIGLPSLPSGAITSIDPFATLVVMGNGINHGDVNFASAGNNGFAPYMIYSKARGTLTTPAIVQNGDQLSATESWGYDGTAYAIGSGIYTFIEGAPGAGDLPTSMSFAVTADGAGTPTERMRIIPNGNIGIGTTAPTSKLQIIVPNDKNDNPSDNGLYVFNAGNAGDNDDAILAARVAGANAGDAFVSFDVSGVTGWSVGLDNSDGDKFKIGNAWSDPGVNTMMTIQTNGNIGIGTSTPSDKLQIATSNSSIRLGVWALSANYNLIDLKGANGNDYNFLSSTLDPNLYINRGTGWDMHFRMNNVTQMILNSAGNVGIGNAAPSARLYVRGATSNVMTVESTSPEADIHYICPSGTWQVGTDAAGNGTGGNEFFVWNGAYHFTVQQGSGNVGIGTTAPNVGLSVIKPAHGIAALGTGVFITGGASGDNACMELRGGTSYIDFTNGGGEDFDMRLLRDGDDRLLVEGGQLFVTSWRSENFGNVGTFAENFLGFGDVGFASGNLPIAIRANNWYAGDVYASYSDRRIKRDIQVANAASDLATLRLLKVSDYKHVDFVTHGDKERKGFIAQEVAEVFPQAIGKTEGAIPNIYQPSVSTQYSFENQTLTVSMKEKVNLQVGDIVQLIVGHDRREVPVIAVNETSFTVSKWREAAEEVFVFGTVVDDFHVVDYDRIFVLGISAIQELDRKTTELEKLKAEVEAMKADIQALKNK